MLKVCSLSVRDCSCLFLYVSERMIWKKKERSGIRDPQMDNLRGLLVVRRMDKIPNERIRELCGTVKGVDTMFGGIL